MLNHIESEARNTPPGFWLPIYCLYFMHVTFQGINRVPINAHSSPLPPVDHVDLVNMTYSS